MTLSSTQTYIYKLTEAFREDFSANSYGTSALTAVGAYTGGADSSEALGTLCSALSGILDSFSSNVSEKISTHKAISELMVPCKMLSVGNDVFYHDTYSHTFYKCEGTVATLLYTAGPTLASFQAAENACRSWVNDPATDYYGSYSGDCSDASILANPLDYCLAGRDFPIG